jgi:predicted nucleic acid-binding Zn ribbon protein
MMHTNALRRTHNRAIRSFSEDEAAMSRVNGGNPVCVICGQAFTPHAPHQTTCSTACSHELNNQQKRAWDREHPRAARSSEPLPVIACKYCGTSFQPSRRNHCFCSRECRQLGSRKTPPPTPLERETALAAHAAWANKCAQSLQRSSDRGRCWTRSCHGADLEAHGLPGNFDVASKLTGLSEGTLRMRQRRGTDLLKPLARNRRCGRFEEIPLSICSHELKAQARVQMTPAQWRHAELEQRGDEDLEGFVPLGAEVFDD